MAKKSFLLVSLQDKKTKKLAQVISNDTSRKILDYLAENTTTETELATKLELPLSTVHYNLKLLVEAKLVKTDEYHYSEKGKEVNHYSLANQYIIIAPESLLGLRSKLRSILPVALIATAAAGLLQVFSNMSGSAVSRYTPELAPKLSADAGTMLAAPVTQSSPPIAIWFLLGSIFAVSVYLLLETIKSRME
ncbi:MAG: winged helix-turn-helix domain-containing protein [Candidatus Woesearchaeota archaeon]